MADFKVVLSALTALAGKYSSESSSYERVASQLNIHPPDSGDGTLNETMQTLIDELGSLNTHMAASLRLNAQKIKSCRDKYEIADDPDKNRFLWDNMMNGVQ